MSRGDRILIAALAVLGVAAIVAVGMLTLIGLRNT